MKKVYMLTISVSLMLLGFTHTFAQDLPWPDLGDAMIIEPGEPGKINDVIHADTSATGERLHNHYILRRGQTYLYTARIQNNGWPLMVTAEDGDGALPIIKALGPATGEDEAERIFHAQGDLYIKDLVLNGWDQGGNYTDNATVRLAADEITVVCDNIMFDFNRQNNLRVNAAGCSLYVANSIISNQGISSRLWQGFALHMRGNPYPIIHFQNNTIYNMHNTTANSGSPARYNKLIFEHNTVVNTGTGGFNFGRPDSLIFKNNLYVNMGILGDAIVGDRDNFAEPFYYFSIDSAFTDETNTTLQEPMHVDFTNNHFYLDPDVAALLPDSANKSTASLMHPYLLDLIGDGVNVVADEAFSFTNFPATLNEYEAYINDFYTFADEPAQMPQFETDFRVMDFSYSESHDAYSAATDGGPLGDRNWFPNYVGLSSFTFQNFDVYPNPVENQIRVSLKSDQTVDRVVISNILGQEMKSVQNITGKEFVIDARELNTGIYFVKFYRNNSLSGTSKIIKK
ncbi:MAG: T9SS type A sorting domain-containing protein [bacterium]